jgi:hypothetical protein
VQNFSDAGGRETEYNFVVVFPVCSEIAPPPTSKVYTPGSETLNVRGVLVLMRLAVKYLLRFGDDH